MTVKELTYMTSVMMVHGLSVRYPTVGAVCLAFGAFHLNNGMSDPQVTEFVLNLFPYVIGLAYFLVADLDMGGEGRYPVADRPYMYIMHADHARDFGYE